MILEEAIEHAEKAAGDYEKMSHEHYFDHEEMEKYTLQCRQYAEWLRELKERREQPEVVHCGDCKHYKIDHPTANGYHCCYRCHNIFPMKEDDFCSRGERRN